MSDHLTTWPTDRDGVRLCSKCGKAEADDADGLCLECYYEECADDFDAPYEGEDWVNHPDAEYER